MAVGSVACALSTVMVLMVGFSQQDFVLENQSFDLPQVVRSDTAVACQPNDGLDPELAFALGCPDMDMGRFHPFIRVEMEPEASDAQRLQYRFSLSSA